MKVYNNIKKQNMNKDNHFWDGVAIGFTISTIICSILSLYIISKTNSVHKQELDYIIEKHQTWKHTM